MDLNHDNKYMRLNEAIEETDKNKQKNRRKKNGLTIFLGFIAISAVTGCLFLFFTYASYKKGIEERDALSPITYTIEEKDELVKKAMEENTQQLKNTMKNMLQNGIGSLTMIRSFFPEEVVAVYGNEYSFFPISDTIKKNQYVDENFKLTESGELEYMVDGTKVSKKGIDVSKYQGVIDWNLVRGSQVEYAFIRMAIRGYESGLIVLDETFDANMIGATQAGLQVGTYFFSQAITEEEALEEANFVIEQLKSYTVTYPVVLDIEDVNSESARTNILTMEQRTDLAIIFMERIKEAGYKPMIYGNLKTFFVMLDMERLEEYSKWFAYYGTPVYFPYAYDVLQYTEKGKVSGIEGEVDLNITFE